MAEGQVKVEIVTMDAVANLEDLKKKIKEAKDNLATLNLGSKEYRQQLNEVIQGQNLLRAAMNGTTAETEHLLDAIDKEGQSYNSLVNQMAALTRAFRATTDEAERANLAGQIRAINDQLKEMDAMRGNFQRNVGDYFNQTSKALKDVIKDLPSGLDKVKGPLRDIEGTMGLMSSHPIIGIIGLLAPLLAKIAGELKENDNAMKSIKTVMDSLKPVMDFFQGVLENIVDIVSDLIGKASEFFAGSNIFQKIVQGVMGVGNAVLQFVIAPFKGIVAAIQVLKDEGVKGLRNAAKAFNDEANKGISFRQNFQTGQKVADTIIEGASSRKKKARDAGNAIGKEMADGWKEEMERRVKEYADNVKARAEAQKYLQGLRDATAKDTEALIDQLDSETEKEMEAILARMEDEAEAERIIQEMSVKEAQDAAKKKMAAYSAYADGVSGLMTSIADALESGDDASEESVKAAKNLRIAAATIDMISGAVTAFSTAQSLGPIAGPIVGAINAAAVVASGLANIAKIRSTSVSKDSTPSAATAATVSAPSMPTVSPTTVTTGASTETALNQAAQPQKVYILQSEIEAAGQTSQVQVAESSF